VSGVRLPRKGILIRLCIYVPIILFLSWRAFQKWSEERNAVQVDPLEQQLAPHKRTITLPDGSQQTVYEMTQDEAEAILGPMPNPASMSTGTPTGGAPKAGDSKAAADVKAEPAPAEAPADAR